MAGIGLKGGIACAMAFMVDNADLFKLGAFVRRFLLEAGFREEEAFNGFAVGPFSAGAFESGRLFVFFAGGDGCRS
jgi:hypothetical protein